MDNKELNLEKSLTKYFGYKNFRSHQKEVIRNVLDEKDAIVLMPTGGGKSICYQLPAILKDGLTIVISPLIALMKDQVQQLQSHGVAANFLNSSMNEEEQSDVIKKVGEGTLKLLYIAPEKLFSGNFLQYFKSCKLSLIAIDEAHCMSSWGHSFRPEYKKLGILKEHFPNIPLLALTATADKAVRSDIGELLQMVEPNLFISSFDRPNLYLSILPGQKKWEQIYRIVSKYPDQSGIIYCNSRAGTEKLADKLNDKMIVAKAYHAGMDSHLRDKVQDEFISGVTHIIVATVAFGMGIDKKDVRFVIHNNMPGNLESYYQEIGRAGRDGKAAEAILFYSYRDVQTQMGFISQIENHAYREILELKLKRMKDFAEAQICRRKILLSYFCEIIEEDCNHCDVCNNPPDYFDGTILAQKALSAVVRSKEQMGISLLIDVLKGRYSATVQERSLDQLKTFGAGNNETAFAWQLYVQQLIQQGFLEIDYKDNYYLKVNDLSWSVLSKSKTVKLVTLETIKKRQKSKKIVEENIRSDHPIDHDLFLQLKSVRKSISQKEGRPAFLVFSDQSLKDMCKKLPKTIEDFLDVHGVGEHKAKQYGSQFVDLINKY